MPSELGSSRQNRDVTPLCCIQHAVTIEDPLIFAAVYNGVGGWLGELYLLDLLGLPCQTGSLVAWPRVVAE